MILTPRQLFKATSLHRKTEGLLWYADFTPDLEKRVRKEYGLADGADLREYFGMYARNSVACHPPVNHEERDFRRYYADIEIPQGAFINQRGVLEIPSSTFHFTRIVSPLRNANSIKDIEEFPYPSAGGYSAAHLAREVEGVHGRGGVASCWVGQLYEAAWAIRGYEQFLMDMIINEEWCEYILDKLMQYNLAVAEAAAGAGADCLETGDDVANQKTLMFSIELWRKYLKPRWARIYATARAINPDITIWYHSDGNIEQIIPELIEIGVDILNPVQPECVDPYKIKELYGDKLVIDGGIGTQTTMPFGTPGDVRSAVRKAVEVLGNDGAYILSPSHVLEPEVPLDNIRALIEAAKELNG